MTDDTPQSLLEAFLKTYPAVRYLRIVVTPYSGVQMMKAVPIANAREMAARANVVVPGTETPPVDGQSKGLEDSRGVVQGTFQWLSSMLAGLTELGGLNSPTASPGYDCVQIDWLTLKPILSHPSHAYVTCSLYNNAEGSDWYGYAMDPRILLRNIEKRAKEEYDLEFLVGHEVELTLCEPSDPPKPMVHCTPGRLYSNQYGSRAMKIVEEIVDGLEHAGVRVWSMHPENSLYGQFEFQLYPATPSVACDWLEFAIHTIRSVANKHNVIATLMAVPFENVTTGRHFHISHTHPELNNYFRAGLLHHIAALSSALIGSVEGWTKRSHFTGGTTCFWSRNKFAPINNYKPGRFEVRLADCHYACHMQLAHILLAGIDGIKHKRQIAQKEEITLLDTFQCMRSGPDSVAVAEVWAKYHVEKNVPKDFEEAIAKYQEDMDVWKEGLGERAPRYFAMVTKRRFEDSKKERPEDMRKTLMANM